MCALDSPKGFFFLINKVLDPPNKCSHATIYNSEMLIFFFFKSMSCVKSMGEILSQCICIINPHIVHYKYLTVLFVNYTSIKLKIN